MIHTNKKQKLNEVYSGDILLEINEETRNRIQRSLLDMFLEVQDICLENQIMVYLCGGSALGAVRHGGFIPWDDDIDISMTRAGYKKFIRIYEKELSDRYILNAPNYSDPAKSRFPKIIKKGTLFRELGDNSDPDSCGLFLDIFIIDNVPDNWIHRMLKGILCNILELIGGQVAMVESGAELKILFKRAGKIAYYFRYLCGRVFSFRSAASWYNSIDKIIQHRNNKSKYCSLATGSRHYFGEMLNRSDFIPCRRTEFEGHGAYLFNQAEKYLSNLYGEDYMTIPAPEKRQRHFIKELLI